MKKLSLYSLCLFSSVSIFGAQQPKEITALVIEGGVTIGTNVAATQANRLLGYVFKSNGTKRLEEAQIKTQEEAAEEKQVANIYTEAFRKLKVKTEVSTAITTDIKNISEVHDRLAVTLSKTRGDIDYISERITKSKKELKNYIPGTEDYTKCSSKIKEDEIALDEYREEEKNLATKVKILRAKIRAESDNALPEKQAELVIAIENAITDKIKNNQHAAPKPATFTAPQAELLPYEKNF